MIKYIDKIFFLLLRIFKRPYRGRYKSWEKALKKSTGYSDEPIISQTIRAFYDVANGWAKFERDSLLFYQYEIDPWVEWVKKDLHADLKVLDFGGGMATAYFKNRPIFIEYPNLKWYIIEQKVYVKHIEVPSHVNFIKFIYNSDPVKDEYFDLLILGCVLPYLEKPYEVFEELIKLNFKYLIIDKHPLKWGSKDRLTIQTVNPKIYPASYPAWFFSSKKFKKFLKDHNLSIIHKYENPDFTNVGIGFFTFIIKKNES